MYVIIVKITLYAPFQHLETLNTDCVQMLLSPTLTDIGMYHVEIIEISVYVVNLAFQNFHPSTFNLLISF